MKKSSKWALAGIALGFAIHRFIIPWGLTAYVNMKYAPEIHVEYSSLVWLKLDCARFSNVKIAKPTMSGTIESVVACYREKTIEANGGKLDVVVAKSSGKDSGTHGFTVTAKNLEVHVTKGDISADLSGTTVYPIAICATKVLAHHQKADAVMLNLCFNRKNNSFKALSGIVMPKLEIKGHKISDISFTGLLKASNTELSVGEIRYEEDNVVSDVSASIKDGLISVNIGSLTASHNKLFSSPLTVKDIKISGISKKDPLSSKVVVGIGEKVTLLADVDKRRISGKDTCDNWFDIVPKELKDGPISQMKIRGMFGFDIQFGKPISLKINSTCSIDGPTPEFITDLSKPFKYTAYHPDGTSFERIAGPGTNDWIPLDFVDNMATALTITEDPGFWHHRGIIPQALENSLKDDMRLGRFFRGGSTITMQLAKNLWLNRSRTLGRKLQEGILTIALESCLSKEKILELYLNVVEFGPNIYGIGPGCAKFLKKYPGEISLSEAMYMAIRLPSPNKVRSYEASKGFIKKLIAIGVATGKISEDELATELQAEQAKEQEEDSEDD
jgi:hypothetical protein